MDYQKYNNGTKDTDETTEVEKFHNGVKNETGNSYDENQNIHMNIAQAFAKTYTSPKHEYDHHFLEMLGSSPCNNLFFGNSHFFPVSDKHENTQHQQLNNHLSLIQPSPRFVLGNSLTPNNLFSDFISFKTPNASANENAFLQFKTPMFPDSKPNSFGYPIPQNINPLNFMGYMDSNSSNGNNTLSSHTPQNQNIQFNDLNKEESNENINSITPKKEGLENNITPKAKSLKLNTDEINNTDTNKVLKERLMWEMSDPTQSGQNTLLNNKNNGYFSNFNFNDNSSLKTIEEIDNFYNVLMSNPHFIMKMSGKSENFPPNFNHFKIDEEMVQVLKPQTLLSPKGEQIKNEQPNNNSLINNNNQASNSINEKNFIFETPNSNNLVDLKDIVSPRSAFVNKLKTIDDYAKSFNSKNNNNNSNISNNQKN